MSTKGATYRRWATTTVLSIAVAALLVPTGSMARPRATVSLGFAGGILEGAEMPFSWSSRHLGRGTKLVLQRPVGTSHTWKTLTRLPSLSGSWSLTGLPLGRYRYRIAALRGRWLLAQQVVGVGVFGRVPLSVLFRGREFEDGVYTTPSQSFPYVGQFWPGEFDDPETAFAVEHNHCIGVHVAFAPGYEGLPSHYNKSTVTGTVTVVQESRDPVSASAPFDGISAVDAQLVPGQSWSVTTSYKGEFEPAIFLNGYAVCDSTESFFQ